MAKAIDAAKAHYEAFTGEGRLFIDVPEWGSPEKPFRIYWRPMTLRERKKIFGVQNEEAECVFLKAEDEAGKRMFTEVEELHALANQVDAMVLGRIAARMATAATVRDMEKN